MILSAILFSWLLAARYYILLVLTVLSATAFNFLLTAVFYFLLELIALLVTIFSIKFFLFISNYSIGFIGNSKSMLDYLVSFGLFRFFYLYGAS